MLSVEMGLREMSSLKVCLQVSIMLGYRYIFAIYFIRSCVWLMREAYLTYTFRLKMQLHCQWHKRDVQI